MFGNEPVKLRHCDMSEKPDTPDASLHRSGTAANHPGEQPAPRTLRLASYNIHRCIGSDGRYDPERIREVLHALDADVVALQEVEVFRHDPGLLDFLCPDRAWRPVHGITMTRDSGDYGNAMLTRLPVTELQRQDLTFPGREPRGALHMQVDIDGIAVRVTATHFGLRPVERRAQAQAVADELDAAVESADKPDLTVLMGDFNEWFLWGRALRRLRRRFLAAPALRTFPARWPLFSLDRIWVTPGARDVSIETVNTPLTRAASDHLPLLARLRLG
jgi:endonuclease/exonuclease/phosphatase family metal-dependent hydrolase